jgi:enamine deaminase RidA (YjgF/YER057c/UK114 family)
VTDGVTGGRAMAIRRRNFSSGGPYEASVGYSRAVAIGDSFWLAGTTDAGPDGTSAHPGDAGRQARAIFEIADRVLREAGFTFDDVVRSRMFVVRPEDVAAVTAAHGDVFGSIRPVATLVLIAGLMDPSLLVEIELEARRA